MIIWYLNGTPQICRGLLRQDLHSTCVLLCTRIQIDFQMSSGCAIWRPGWWPCRGRWPWPSQTRQLLRKNRYRRYPSTVRRFFKSLFFPKQIGLIFALCMFLFRGFDKSWHAQLCSTFHNRLGTFLLKHSWSMPGMPLPYSNIGGSGSSAKNSGSQGYRRSHNFEYFSSLW